MRIVSIFDDKLYALWNEDADADEFALQFEQWNDVEYLHNFFCENKEDLQREIWNGISEKEAITETLNDAERLEAALLENGCEILNRIFKFLNDNQTVPSTLDSSKCYGLKRLSWLRLYGLRIEKGVYVITGGAIKLTHKMEEREHTRKELKKLELARRYLLEQGILDKEGIEDFIEFQF